MTDLPFLDISGPDEPLTPELLVKVGDLVFDQLTGTNAHIVSIKLDNDCVGVYLDNTYLGGGRNPWEVGQSIAVKIPVKNSATPMLVDAADAPLMQSYKWRLHTGGYAVTCKREGKRKISIYAHCLIIVIDKQVDHVDRNKLNNQRYNLRPATHAEQQQNKGLKKTNTSGYIGVNWCKKNQTWNVRIRINGKRTHVGCFKDIDDAATAYNFAAEQHYGDFAVLNYPKPQAGRAFVPLDKPATDDLNFVHDMKVGPCSCGAWHDGEIG